MQFVDKITGRIVTFLDCEGGRDVVDEQGNEFRLWYKPAQEPSFEDMLRSLPTRIVNPKESLFPPGEIGKYIGFRFVKD